MQITFLVGNGFDISCGIDTSYKGFYDWYLKQSSSSDVIKQFKEEIKDYMLGKGEYWADFEAGLGQFSKNFTKSAVNNFIEIYEDAHDSIISYIDQERKKYNISVDAVEIQDSLKKGVLNFTQELTPDEQDLMNQLRASDKPNDTLIYFISFNYTDVLDVCVKELAKSPLATWQYNGVRKMAVAPSVLHIHGTIDHYPILGVGEEYQFANKELLSCPGVTEIMLKSESVQLMGEHWYRDAAKQIANSQIICIWGMSLGITDSHWWRKINEWLNGSSSRHLLVFWYTETPPNGRSIYLYYRKKEKIIETMMEYSSFTAEQIEKISKQIHIIYNTENVLRVSFKKNEVLSH